MKPYLSLIIPVYNETTRLHNLKEVIDFLKKQKFLSELLVVDDGSTDETLSELKNWQKKGGLKIISYQPNHGKGYAIKKGMLAASGQFRLFMDVDLSTPLSELKNFLPYLNQADLIIASRKTRGAKLIARQSLIRETLGKGFTRLSQLVLGVGVSDFTCGFKCFSEKAAEKIFKITRIERWGFDSEVLFLAKKLGLTIKEIPVSWKHDAQSKVKFPRDLIRSFNDLATIRLNDLKGKY
jgi:glycosyltransferase involved in cell wall biosynthesis